MARVISEGTIFQQRCLKCCCVVVYQWKLLDLTFTTYLCETFSCKVLLVFIPNVVSIGPDWYQARSLRGQLNVASGQIFSHAALSAHEPAAHFPALVARLRLPACCSLPSVI